MLEVSVHNNRDRSAAHLAMAVKTYTMLVHALMLFCFAWPILAQDGLNQDALFNPVRKRWTVDEWNEQLRTRRVCCMHTRTYIHEHMQPLHASH